MDIQKYLSEKQKSLNHTSDRIRQFQVFDFNYIPARPLLREEAKPIIDAILRYRQTGIANHTLILGSRGSGKSLLARYLMQTLARSGQIHFAYANCRQYNTSFKILASLLGVRPRGCSLDELWQQFTDRHQGKTVMILDEVDLMSDKDRQKEILYLISRSPQNYMAILLSNNPKFLTALDESTQSTLQPEIIHFKSYHVNEIEQILKDRARVGLKFMPAGRIQEIAALTVKNTNSDVRVAIKTLYSWALEPEIPLKEHFEKARRDILVEVIRDLNDKNLLILRAALAPSDGYVKEVYQSYRKISIQFHEEPFSYVHFYSNLSYLQSLGLILLVSTKVGRTYTNRIQLTFDPAVLQTIWQARFG
jgi:Cdc6-like AAA superfamily ATPase